MRSQRILARTVGSELSETVSVLNPKRESSVQSPDPDIAVLMMTKKPFTKSS